MSGASDPPSYPLNGTGITFNTEFLWRGAQKSFCIGFKDTHIKITARNIEVIF